MLTPLPETVQSILGENATRDLARWLEDAMREGHIPREEWNDARTRLANVEHGVGVLQADVSVVQTQVTELRADMRAFQSDVNARFDRMNEGMNDRFDSMNGRFDSMNQSFNDRFDRQEERMARQTRWAIGLVGLMSTSVTVLLAIQTLMPGG